MATNEDVSIAEKGVVVLFTEKTSTMLSGMPLETIEIPEMTVVNRAMVNPIAATGCVYPVMMSGGCSGNAITIGWAVSGCVAIPTTISGDENYVASGHVIAIVAIGH